MEERLIYTSYGRFAFKLIRPLIFPAPAAAISA
jgi:hypothetical protein